jgi:hypothetical protein
MDGLWIYTYSNSTYTLDSIDIRYVYLKLKIYKVKLGEFNIRRPRFSRNTAEDLTSAKSRPR